MTDMIPNREEAFRDLERLYQDLCSERDALLEECIELRRSVEDCRKERTAATEHRDKLERWNSAQAGSIRDLERVLASTKKDKQYFVDRLDEYKKLHASAEAHNKRLEQELASVTTQFSDGHECEKRLRAQLDRSSALYGDVVKKNGKLREKLEQLENHADANEARSDEWRNLHERHKKARARVLYLEQEHNRLVKELSNSNKFNEAYIKKLNEYEDKLEDKEEELDYYRRFAEPYGISWDSPSEPRVPATQPEPNYVQPRIICDNRECEGIAVSSTTAHTIRPSATETSEPTITSTREWYGGHPDPVGPLGPAGPTPGAVPFPPLDEVEV